jgi:hypothetical protein
MSQFRCQVVGFRVAEERELSGPNDHLIAYHEVGLEGQPWTNSAADPQRFDVPENQGWVQDQPVRKV